MSVLIVIFISMLIAVNAQRSPYAGVNRGSGYKDRYVPTSSTETTVDVNNRIGDGTTGTTQRLPYDAYGDQYIVNHWNSLPVEQRPFWIVNQQHIEAQRGTPPSPASSTAAVRPSGNPSTNPEFVNRFGVAGDQSTVPNVPQFQEVVYPANITPEQQLNMEIQFLQDRLDILKQRQNQNQNVQPQVQQQQLQQQQQQLQQQQQQLQQQQQRRLRSQQRF